MSDEAPAVPSPERREQAVQVLTELLRLMEFPAKLDAKDATDGGISVALMPEGEFPGVQAGRRSHVMDAVQFIANKMVNRAGMEKRWVSIGVGAHPEPRPPPGARRPPAPPPAAGATVPSAAQMPDAVPPPPRIRPPPPAPRPPVDAEASVQAPEDAGLSALGQLLARKSATHGRFYAVWPMKLEDRARMLKAAQGVPEVRAFAEGEGRNRRLVFAPDKPVPMPKRSALPADVEEE
jgi:predicted RNA-binding protein Jag